MNVVLYELKRNFKSTIIWALGISGMNILTMLFYPTIVEQSENLNKIIQQMPRELLAAFGMDKLNFTDILGYYASKGYTFLLLFGAIFAIMLFSSILSREENEKTIEFLLSKPVTRSEILTEKLAAAILLVVLFNALVTAATWISFELVKITDYDIRLFLLLALGSLLLNMIFGALGIFLSLLFRRGRAITSLSIAVVLITYFLSIVANLSESLENIRYITPFKYVDPVDIIMSKGIQTEHLAILSLVTLVLLVLSYVIYNRKNIVM